MGEKVRGSVIGDRAWKMFGRMDSSNALEKVNPAMLKQCGWRKKR